MQCLMFMIREERCFEKSVMLMVETKTQRCGRGSKMSGLNLNTGDISLNTAYLVFSRIKDFQGCTGFSGSVSFQVTCRCHL